MYTTVPEFNELMKEAAAKLNLAPHAVGRTKRKLLYSCCDIEGHVGRDGRKYVLWVAMYAGLCVLTSPLAFLFFCQIRAGHCSGVPPRDSLPQRDWCAYSCRVWPRHEGGSRAHEDP